MRRKEKKKSVLQIFVFITFCFEITSTQLTTHCLKYIFHMAFHLNIFDFYNVRKVVQEYILGKETKLNMYICCGA